MHTAIRTGFFFALTYCIIYADINRASDEELIGRPSARNNLVEAAGDSHLPGGYDDFPTQ
jgi:hypothetical protein